MRTFTRGTIQALVVAFIFTAPSTSWGAGGRGGGGGGGTGTTSAAGALYGDLYVIERDGNGKPVPTVSDPIQGVVYSCQQPLAASCAFLPLNFQKVPFNPEVEDGCAVQDASALQLQEVKFGRESVARAPATVIDKSYGEALKTINLAVPGSKRLGAADDRCTRILSTGVEWDERAVKLDPAGRITLCLASETVSSDGTVSVTHAWKTIDAPLENLGLYRAAMTTGCFGPVKDTVIGEEGVPLEVTIALSGDAASNLAYSGLDHLVCDGTTLKTSEDLLSAAVFLAAGADKESPVTLDEVVNLNNYLGINTWTYTTAQKVKTLNITYFQFKVGTGGVGTEGWFGYTNGVDACNKANTDTWVSLLTAAGPSGSPGSSFVPAVVKVFDLSPPGVSLADAAVTVCRAGLPLQANGAKVVCDDAGNNPVYGNDGIYGCGGANWFTQAAEDARKTIWYLHNWRLPVVGY